MLREEQALLLSAEKARNDFPLYELGPMIQSACEDQCWYVCIRLYKRTTREALDCWYGVYRANHEWTAMLFDHLPRRMQRHRIFEK